MLRKIRMSSDEIFSLREPKPHKIRFGEPLLWLQMKYNSLFSSREAGFHHEAISFTKGKFIPSARTDFVEKSQVEIRLGFSGGEGEI